LAEIRPDLGRPHDVAHRKGLQIASILKGDNHFLKIELDSRLLELGGKRVVVPWNVVKRGREWPLPRDAQFEFFGKEISEPILAQWSKIPWGDEKLTLEQRFDRALGTYDWIIQTKPDALVTWTDSYPEMRAACMAMKAIGRPVIEVAHGAFHVYTHGHFEAKAFCDWRLGSWEYRQWHNFYKIKADCLASGLTNMDVWAKQDLELLRATARHELEIPKVATVVCYLGDTAFERNAWMDPKLADMGLVHFLRDWMVARKLIPNAHLIFKKHPYDRGKTLEQYKELIEGIGILDNYTLVDDNLVVAIAPSDLLVGPRSSAMISGLMLGIPSLIVDFTPFFDEHNYRGMGFEVAREEPEVLSKLVELTTDSSRMISLIDQTQKGSAWFSGAQDKQASDRASEAILRIAMGENPSELVSELPALT